MESYRINAACLSVCLSVSIYSKLLSRDWDKAQDAKHNPLSLRIKKQLILCNNNKNNGCVRVELMDRPPLRTLLASSCKKCKEEIPFTSPPHIGEKKGIKR